VLEGLEVDQYIWGIVQSLSNAPYDEVTIDTAANWRLVPALGVAGDQQDPGLLRALYPHTFVKSSIVICYNINKLTYLLTLGLVITIRKTMRRKITITRWKLL